MHGKFGRLDQVEDFHIRACDPLIPRCCAATGQRDYALGAQRVPVHGPPEKRKPIQYFVADFRGPGSNDDGALSRRGASEQLLDRPLRSIRRDDVIVESRYAFSGPLDGGTSSVHLHADNRRGRAYDFGRASQLPSVSMKDVAECSAVPFEPPNAHAREIHQRAPDIRNAHHDRDINAGDVAAPIARPASRIPVSSNGEN